MSNFEFLNKNNSFKNFAKANIVNEYDKNYQDIEIVI